MKLIILEIIFKFKMQKVKLKSYKEIFLTS